MVRAVKKLAKEADSLVIATDFDREGELIGLEALNIATEENEHLVRTVRRARFSALTPGEIKRAFAALDHLSEPLAHAGEARQDIDLIWGATLTRFVSLATSRLGNQFLSVGRVQTPTLVLIAEREKERRAFVSEPYWVVTVDLTAKGQRSRPRTRKSASPTRPGARAVFDKLAGPATVTQLKQTTRKVPRPAPFNTTSFTSAATSLGYSASAVMRIAEDLYMGGYISYPRTDNTVYPSSLDLREVLDMLAQRRVRPRGARVAGPADADAQPGRQADHRPPAHLSHRGSPPRRAGRPGVEALRAGGPALHGHAGRRCGLGVQPGRRRDRRRAVLPAGSGWSRRAGSTTTPTAGRRTSSCPRSTRAIGPSWSTSRSTPARRSRRPGTARAPLIELMEKHNLGTKATRHTIIQNLYDRGYIHGNPVEPTEMGIKMAEALQEYAPRIASPEMTAELEKDMDVISERDLTKDQVVTISRDLLREAYRSLEENRRQCGPDLRGHHRRPDPGRVPQVRHQQDPHHPLESDQEALRRLRGLPGLRSDLSAAAAGRHHLDERDLPAVRQSPDQGPDRAGSSLGAVPRPDCPTKAEYKAKVAARNAAIAAKEASGERTPAARASAAKKTTTAGRAAAAKKTTAARKTTAAKKTTAATKAIAATKATAAKKTTAAKKPVAAKKPAAAKTSSVRKPATAVVTSADGAAVADTVPTS